MLTTAIACSAVLLASPSAFADKSSARDTSGDALSFAEGDIDNAVMDPAHTDADITKSWVNHTDGRVNIKVKLRDLTSIGSGEFRQLYADIKTNKNHQAAITYKFGGEKTGFALVRGKKEIRCRGVRNTISPSLNIIKISVPRSCLGKPTWVKVGMAALSGSGTQFHHDDALSSRSDLTNGLRYTPKLRKG